MSSIKKIRTTDGDMSIDYNSLDNLPTIPSKISELENDREYINKNVGNLSNYYSRDEIDEKNFLTEIPSPLKDWRVTSDINSIGDNFIPTCETVKEYADNLNNYSLENEIKIGKWIDGKPIYKKTINFGTLLNRAEKTVDHNIPDIDFIIKIDGITKATTGQSLPLPYLSLYGENTTIQATNRCIIIDTEANMSAYTQTYITLYYTKTTD